MTAPHTPPQTNRMFGLMGVGVGSLALLVGGCSCAGSAGEWVGARGTTGTVVAMESPGGSDGEVPVVEYEVDGAEYRARGKVAFSPPMHKVGDRVNVLYKADRPNEGAVDSFMDRWFFALFFGGLGGFFAVFGVMTLIARRRRTEGEAASVSA